jgi:6-phosphogluconolactonase/glucosamine-6-phosphate isomerase/deaminase
VALQIEICPGADAVARRGAEHVARRAGAAIADHGRFTFAVSGGTRRGRCSPTWWPSRSRGRTASLVPGDPVLGISDRDVALSGTYQGRRRMTLTYPVLERAPNVLWLITGADKADALARPRAGDHSIAAGRISTANALVIADEAAAGGAAR